MTTAPTCDYRPSNVRCGRRATHLVRFPEGERHDQACCAKHQDKLWLFYGHYIPGKGGIVTEFLQEENHVTSQERTA